MYKKNGFTLLEVLISISLLSLVLMALYKSTEILRASNKHLFKHLERSSDAMIGAKTLYMDIIQSDNNMTINTKKEFHHITINSSRHSLYGLSKAKITWVVYKEKNTLLRIEGSNYSFPLKNDDKVMIDPIIGGMELFKIYKNRSKQEDKILVAMKSSVQNVQTFMIQNLKEPPLKHLLVTPSSLRTKNKNKRGNRRK